MHQARNFHNAAARQAFTSCTDRSTALPIFSDTPPDLLQMLQDTPAPSRPSGCKRTAESIAPDSDEQGINGCEHRRLRGKQTVRINLDTPLSNLVSQASIPEVSPQPQDDFDLPLTAIGGPEETPLDAVEPSDEQLQVAPINL